MSLEKDGAGVQPRLREGVSELLGRETLFSPLKPSSYGNTSLSSHLAHHVSICPQNHPPCSDPFPGGDGLPSAGENLHQGLDTQCVVPGKFISTGAPSGFIYASPVLAP